MHKLKNVWVVRWSPSHGTDSTREFFLTNVKE